MKKIIILVMAAITIGPVSLFAQAEKSNKSKAPGQETTKTKMYSCPMHPEVTSDKQGKCSKCGMNLKKIETASKSYVCPMHPDVTSDNPGKCSKCGMNLKKIETASKSYSCPMHPDVTSDNPGKCSKCGMDLNEKKEDHSNHQH
jgi:predicted RNA-binding Zn-ribbon protein involved in translation (DUF1610 family)